MPCCNYLAISLFPFVCEFWTIRSLDLAIKPQKSEEMGKDPHTAQECHSALAIPCLYWYQTKSLKGSWMALHPWF